MAQPSGKFVLRIDPSLHSRLRLEAEGHDMSLNEWIVRQLTGQHGPSPSPVLTPMREAFGQHLIGLVQFGSSVRGEMRASSDVDLLIVLDNQRPIDRSLYLQWDKHFSAPAHEVFSPQFSHLPKNSSYSSLWLEISLEGHILYDPSGAVAVELRKIRERIAAGDYCRKISHGHPYWVRNGDRHAK